MNETQTVVILFGLDSYWGEPLIYFSDCWPGYFPSGVPQIFAVSPGHVLIAHLLACGSLLSSTPFFSLLSTCNPKPGNRKPNFLYSLQ